MNTTIPRCDRTSVQRAELGYSLPESLNQHYGIRRLTKYGGRMFVYTWRSLMRGEHTATWFSADQISRHARIPLEQVSTAQAECIGSGLLIIRPGGGSGQERYMLGPTSVGFVDPGVRQRYTRPESFAQ